jgi:ketosteroid isomerase-like protein
LNEREDVVSSANVDFVQSLYAPFGRGDIATIINALAPDIDWFVNGRREDYPLLGPRKGPAEVQQFFHGIAENQETVEFSPREFYEAENRVFVLGRYVWKLRKTGRSVAAEWVHVFTIRNGKVVAFREFTDTAQFAHAYRG